MDQYEHWIYKDHRVRVYLHIYTIGNAWTWTFKVDERHITGKWKTAVSKHSGKFFEKSYEATFNALNSLESCQHQPEEQSE